MIRQYYTGVNGWTSLKNNVHNVRIKEIVNKYFDELPSKFDPSVAVQSFHVGSESDESIFFHIMGNANSNLNRSFRLGHGLTLMQSTIELPDLSPASRAIAQKILRVCSIL